MDAEVESPLREVSVADIGCLIERLQEHGVHGAKSRCLLLLLQSGVNTCPCRIYASQESGQPLVVITITRQWHGHHALGVFAREDAASLRCLAAAVRAPGLQLWGTPFTADGVPLHVAHVLRTAAEERGLTWDGLAPFDLFVQESCQPPEHVLECPAGVVIRPLNEGHVDQVKRFWEYSDHVPGRRRHHQRRTRTSHSSETPPANRAVTSLTYGAPAFIGLTRDGDKYRWADGGALEYAHWAAGQPADGWLGCVVTNADGNGGWGTANCTETLDFVCSAPANSTLDDVDST
ncbi:uncharacterized protein LOC119097790 [Pollicipes pollicipes]|uniref:uncharacterized protein LOC119097790 n=1 Tax=Pollicipes pollicipes TaxID=41117 RepID=UPI0018851076|nr:uncharacterized protein LOC119097790 [Pollicipes pollicipes]